MQIVSLCLLELKVVPRGKRLTICTRCNKPGYKYQTYFQHYNESPIGKIILKGKVIGDRYRRCSIIRDKNNVPQKDGTGSNIEEALAESEQENSKDEVKQDTQITYKKVVPRGKRLTICTRCNKPGYKYQTYFQHYNESPIGKIILKGKVIGDRYRRCNITNQKLIQKNIDHQANSGLYPREMDKSKIETLLRELGKYIDESHFTLSTEDESGKDYKKFMGSR